MYPNQMYPNQMYPNQMYPNQMYPNQMYPNQMYPNQMYPNQMDANQMDVNQMYPIGEIYIDDQMCAGDQINEDIYCQVKGDGCVYDILLEILKSVVNFLKNDSSLDDVYKFVKNMCDVFLKDEEVDQMSVKKGEEINIEDLGSKKGEEIDAEKMDVDSVINLISNMKKKNDIFEFFNEKSKKSNSGEYINLLLELINKEQKVDIDSMINNISEKYGKSLGQFIETINSLVRKVNTD